MYLLSIQGTLLEEASSQIFIINNSHAIHLQKIFEGTKTIIEVTHSYTPIHLIKIHIISSFERK